MFCGNCGNELHEGSKFCGKCGAPVVVEETPVETPVETPAEAVVVETPAEVVVLEENNKEKDAAASSALTMGILSLALGLAASLVNFIGIIFACMAFKKASLFEQLNNGVLEGKAKVGKGLAKGGLAAGIAMTVIWGLYILIIVFAVLAEMDFYGSFYY